MDVAVGNLIGRYRVLRHLGAGGMATVWLVQHSRIGSLHALKVLDVPSQKVRERLLREGQVQGLLRHPNLVWVSDVLEHEGCPCLLMELVNGPGLDALIAAGPLSLAQVDVLARGLLAGVAAAHAQGLVHRDLKPANILLSIEAGGIVPKVADFGLAKVLTGPGGHTTTRSGIAMGTPAFMAPEQIRDASRVDTRADVFALGAVLYELITGERAFQGDDTFALYEAVTQARFRPLAALRPDLPERMRAAVEAALSVDPDQRPRDAAALSARWVADTPLPVQAFDPVALDAARALGPALPQVEFGGTTSGEASAPVPVAPAEPGPAGAVVARPLVGPATVLALAALVAGAFGWWWFFLRTSVALHSDLALGRDGLLPIGAPIAAVPEGEVGWRVTWRGQTPVRADAVNDRGAPVDPLAVREAPPTGWVVRRELGQVVAFERINRFGAVVLVLHVRPDADGWIVEARHPSGARVSEVDRPLPPWGRETARERWRFDAQGRVRSAHWLDDAGAPMADARGVFGAAMQYDDKGRLVELAWIDIDQQTMFSSDGAMLTRFAYDAAGWLTETALLGLNDARVTGAAGWAARSVERDAQGRPIALRAVDPDGRAVLAKALCPDERWTYEVDGQLRRCFGVDGSPRPSPEGAHALRLERNERGHVIALSYLDEQLVPTVNESGFARVSYQLDEKGVRLGVGPWLDSAGRPVPGEQAAWRRAFVRDARGNLLERRYLGLDGSLMLGDEGAAIVRHRLDEADEVVYRGLFDTKDQPIVGVDGYHKRICESTDARRTVRCASFDAAGVATAGEQGAAVVIDQYNERNQLLVRRLFDVDGRPTVGHAGYAEKRIERDAAGREVGYRFLDADGRLVVPGDFEYARAERVYDPFGREVEHRFFGPDELPAAVSPFGASIWLQEYDRNGHLRWLHLRDAQRRPLAGCTSLRYDYDASGRETREGCYDAEGRPVLRVPGLLHATRTERDTLGRPTLIAYEGVDGAPTEVDDGLARIRAHFEGSALGPVRVHGEDLAGRPAALNGYAEFRQGLDVFGRSVSYTYFGVDGEPYEVDGVAHEELVLDERGGIVVTRRFRADGSGGGANGDAYLTFQRLDERVNAVDVRHFHEDGRPALSAYGWHRATYEYDALGRNIAWVQYGLDGQPTLGAEGYAGKRMRYDARGREVEHAHFGLNAEPVLSLEGYHRASWSLDARGNEVERSHFGVLGEPVRGPEGWHRANRRFDRAGRLVEEAFTDEAGAATFGSDGFARRVIRYDAVGSVASEQRFDAGGAALD